MYYVPAKSILLYNPNGTYALNCTSASWPYHHSYILPCKYGMLSHLDFVDCRSFAEGFLWLLGFDLRGHPAYYCNSTDKNTAMAVRWLPLRKRACRGTRRRGISPSKSAPSTYQDTLGNYFCQKNTDLFHKRSMMLAEIAIRRMRAIVRAVPNYVLSSRPIEDSNPKCTFRTIWKIKLVSTRWRVCRICCLTFCSPRGSIRRVEGVTYYPQTTTEPPSSQSLYPTTLQPQSSALKTNH